VDCEKENQGIMAEQQNKITINGHDFIFEPDETILSVAQRNSIDIPTLCYLKRTLPTGACRICVVEVKGARSLLPACSTPASNNMVVYTESAPVIDARRLILQLLLSSGNHNCAIRCSDGKDWTQFFLTCRKMTAAVNFARYGEIAGFRTLLTGTR